MSVYLPKYIVEAEYASPITSQSTQRLHPKGISSSAFKRAWDSGFTGKNVIVAIIDTGIDGNHPDLKGKVIRSENLTGEPLQESHGTHVAGTIAANGWLVGGAPDASLIDIKVLGQRGGSISNVAKAITMAASYGASVVNLSLGATSLGSSDIQILMNAIQQAWNQGTVCFAAAGNNGTSICSPDPYSYPASVEKAESIAACDVGENLDTIALASFSNENNRVDLAACGRNVISTVMNGNYGIYSGTSMATPHVSAMAAVLTQYIRSKYPNLTGSSFSAALASLIHANVLSVQGCGIRAAVTIKGKPLVMHTLSTSCLNPAAKVSNADAIVSAAYSNISFGLGFLRYNPNKGPVSPNGPKFYHNGIFLGHQITT